MGGVQKEHRLLIFQHLRTTVSFHKRPLPRQLSLHLTTFGYLSRARSYLPSDTLTAERGARLSSQATKLKTAWPGSFTLALLNKNSPPPPPPPGPEHFRLPRPGPALLEPRQAGSQPPPIRSPLSLPSPARQSGLAPHTRGGRAASDRPASAQPGGLTEPVLFRDGRRTPAAPFRPVTPRDHPKPPGPGQSRTPAAPSGDPTASPPPNPRARPPTHCGASRAAETPARPPNRHHRAALPRRRGDGAGAEGGGRGLPLAPPPALVTWRGREGRGVRGSGGCVGGGHGGLWVCGGGGRGGGKSRAAEEGEGGDKPKRRGEARGVPEGLRPAAGVTTPVS